MYFNSYAFILVFMPVVILGYRLLAHTERPDITKLWILLSSGVFYCINDLPGFLILTPLVGLSFLLARLYLSATAWPKTRRALLIYSGVVINVLWLGYFKYTNFFIDTINGVFGTQYPLRSLLLPLGISFLTFQNIQFLLDVLSGEIKSFRFLDYIVFSSFFPRAVAGPIAKYREVMPGLSVVRKSDLPVNIVLGVSLFSIGLFKKCVIADGLNRHVSWLFDTTPPPGGVSLIVAWTGALACTLQIYFDFSGYSDMALAVARILGVKLPVNFNSPLKARSIIEFWGRWHITLTRFLTWNIYVPCVRALTEWRSTRNLPLLEGTDSSAMAIIALVALPTITTMLLSGLWHGAGWQFVLWGGMHGVLLTLNQTFRMLSQSSSSRQILFKSVSTFISTATTFGTVVIAMVFFRAASVSSAADIVASLTGLHGIVPFGAHVAHELGKPLPLALWEDMVHLSPLLWIVGGILPGVFLLPNSMEILRRIETAITRDARVGGAPEHPQPSVVSGRFGFETLKTPRFGWSVSRGGIANGDGAAFLRIATLATALVFVSGVMAIGRGIPFLYANF
jgi:alginate O-acetyltransferase complex protein AlgI